MIELTVNGKSVTLERPMSVAEFLAARGLQAKMVVVEHNREILPRSRYAEITLAPGDEVEIVQMMAGG
jgi:thiamine biosynthesis protein ThiS